MAGGDERRVSRELQDLAAQQRQSQSQLQFVVKERSKAGPIGEAAIRCLDKVGWTPTDRLLRLETER